MAQAVSPARWAPLRFPLSQAIGAHISLPYTANLRERNFDMLCWPTGEPLTMSSARDEKSKEDSAELNDVFLEVANSDMFQRAPVMRTLLIYLWEQRGTTVSEYAIAVDGLRRSSDFDPRTDSTARVQVARLRAKLKTFYESTGRECPLHISIPHGRHELEWTYASPAVFPFPEIENRRFLIYPLWLRYSPLFAWCWPARWFSKHARPKRPSIRPVDFGNRFWPTGSRWR